MKFLLAVGLSAVVAVALVGWFVYQRLKRLAGSQQTTALVESFDAGLAIPMRDSDTRRPPKKPV